MEIAFTQGALDDLAKLPKRFAAQIVRKIQRLESGLRRDIKQLQNADVGYRLRSGNYRILFDVLGEKLLIQRIRHRKEAYD